MAAHRATPDDARRIRSLAVKLPVNPSEESIETDVAFHVAVLRASGNLIIAGLCPAMEVLLRAYLVSMWRLRRGPPLVDQAMNVHVLTADAITRRDAVKARHYSEQMLAVSSLEIDRVLRSMNVPGVMIDGPMVTPELTSQMRELSTMLGAT
jgi:DNA-binding FadR family transcriptional regulator